MKCPHCGKSVKGHAQGTKNFRELSRQQQHSAIAKTARDLKAMRDIYRATAPQQAPAADA